MWYFLYQQTNCVYVALPSALKKETSGFKGQDIDKT